MNQKREVETRTAQLEVWVALAGERRKRERRVKGRGRRLESFMVFEEDAADDGERYV